MRDHARILSIVATEAVEEPDTIARRPEVLDTMASLSKDYDLPDVVERIAPWLAAALARIVSVHWTTPRSWLRSWPFAWVLNQAVADDQPTSDSAALTLA